MMAKNEVMAVPPTGRTLVLCFDGTAEQYDADNSNVVKLFSLLNKDPDQQLCYYDPGIGTWFHPGTVSPLFEWIAKILDLAFAWYIQAHVLDGYKFIMQNYREGDKICLFGFSRGAYTARALGGFLHKIGLLSRDNVSQIPFAYKLYQKEDPSSLELCEGFKRTFCRAVKIDFMGIWDTVASVGVIMGKTLPFTNSNSSVTVFRHALALDERRARFRPNFYHRATPAFMAGARKSNASSDGSSSSSDDSPNSSTDPNHKGPKVAGGRSKGVFSSGKNKPLEIDGPTLRPEGAVDSLPDDVLEVWFVGGHSDVGGGNVLNTEVRALSNIPLRWMVREIKNSGCGMKFAPEALSKLNLNKSDEQDTIDVLENIHDRLTGSFKHRLWWILELIPLTYAWQDKNGIWHKSYGLHLGRGREVYTSSPKFHRSVQVRMAATSVEYKPKAVWTPGTEEYVS